MCLSAVVCVFGNSYINHEAGPSRITRYTRNTSVAPSPSIVCLKESQQNIRRTVDFVDQSLFSKSKGLNSSGRGTDDVHIYKLDIEKDEEEEGEKEEEEDEAASTALL